MLDGIVPGLDTLIPEHSARLGMSLRLVSEFVCGARSGRRHARFCALVCGAAIEKVLLTDSRGGGSRTEALESIDRCGPRLCLRFHAMEQCALLVL